MGNWRNRPRFRRHYKGTPPSPSGYDDTEPPDSGSVQDNVPLWEKKFCSLIGKVPWRKVVDAKKYAHCHSNIVNWDDSAGEEAFHNAKSRFWAEINGLQCDISLPDPDEYIDQIDWNPDVDSELIKDLERAYFNTDESERYTTINNRASCPSEENKLSPEISDNPWERSSRQCNEALKQGCNQWEWDNHVDDLKSGNFDCNPWEHDSQSNSFQKLNGWGNLENNIWGWNQGSDPYNQSRVWDDSYIPQERNCQGVVSKRHRGWGHSENISQSRNEWDQWGHSSTQNTNVSKDRGWRDSAGSSWHCRHWDNKNSTQRNMDLRTGGRSWGDRNESYRKREGDYQKSLRYKSSRFKGVDNSMGQGWRRVG